MKCAEEEHSWASGKGWLLLNDTETRNTCGTDQVAKWAKPVT